MELFKRHHAPYPVKVRKTNGILEYESLLRQKITCE
jgi:hypothetical protein